jgi:hypothetical protein
MGSCVRRDDEVSCAAFPWHHQPENEQGIRMRIVRWAIFIGAVICSTPTYAARCGGD